jgi:hypothetical protein
VRTNLTPLFLRTFEAEVADEFNAAVIRAPVHLSGDDTRTDDPASYEARLISYFVATGSSLTGARTTTLC